MDAENKIPDSEIVPTTSIIDEEIAPWEARVAEKEKEASDLSIQIQDIKNALSVFLGEYNSRVGLLYVELDKLKMQIKEYQRRIDLRLKEEYKTLLGIIAKLQEELKSLKASETYELKERVDQAKQEGRDLLQELAANIKAEIAENKTILDELVAEYKRIIGGVGKYTKRKSKFGKLKPTLEKVRNLFKVGKTFSFSK